MDADSVGVSGTVATASMVRLNWLERHNESLGRYGVLRAGSYAASARLKFGDGRADEACCAAATPAGIAGNRGNFAAPAPGADIPGSL